MVASAALSLLATMDTSSTLWFPILPGVVVFAVGLTLVVAPITSTALGDIPTAQSGIGSGINNAVARVAGLLAIAAIPLAAGLDTTQSPAVLFDGYLSSMLMCAALCVVGAAVAWFGYARDTGKVPAAA